MRGLISQYFLILLIVVLTVSPLLNQQIKAIIVLILFISIVIKRLNKNNLKFSRSIIILVFLSCITILIDLFNVNRLTDFNLYSIYVPLVLLFGYSISKEFNLDKFLYIFEKVIFIVTIISFIS